MRFSISADQHSALVDLVPDGKGAFSVTYSSEDYGTGTGSGLVTGDHYIGVIKIKGHEPDFDATVVGKDITGFLHLWPFPPLHFMGTVV